MKAQFKVEITRRVRYDGQPRQIDDTRACETVADLVRELEAQGGIRIHKGEVDKGANQYGGYLVTWRRVTEAENLFACRCGCRSTVKREGGFRPGHAAKLVGSLLYRVRENAIKLADALELLADRPNLRAKLARLAE